MSTAGHKAGSSAPPSSVLLVGKSRLRETGNATTLERLRGHVAAHGWRCELCDPQDFPDEASIAKAVSSRDVVLGLHLYRSGPVLNVCKDLKKPYVAVCGGTDVNECLRDPSKMRVMSTAVAGAAHLLAFTQDMKDAALAVWPNLRSEHVTVLPQAISVHPNIHFNVTQYLSSVDEEHRSFLSRRGSAEKCSQPSGKIHPLVVLVAGLRPVKDVLYVAEAWSEWNGVRGGSGRLLIMGPALDSDYVRKVNDGAASLCGVRVTGSLEPPECQAVIAASTALLNSSVSEGMSAALLEAMALGTPVLARDIPGNRAVVEDGVTGLLFSSPASFAQQLDRLLADEDLRQKITANASAYVSLHHHPRDEANSLIGVLQEALVSRTPSV